MKPEDHQQFEKDFMAAARSGDTGTINCYLSFYLFDRKSTVMEAFATAADPELERQEYIDQTFLRAFSDAVHFNSPAAVAALARHRENTSWPDWVLSMAAYRAGGDEGEEMFNAAVAKVSKGPAV